MEDLYKLPQTEDSTEQQIRDIANAYSKFQTGEHVMMDGLYRSQNFVTGSSGWQIDAEGNVEFNDGTFRGAISATTIDIGGSDSSSFHVDIDGNMWLGASTFGAAPFSVSNTGDLIATSATISGYVISGKGAFGGDGSDGALSITSGTTTIDLGNAATVTKNYTSISITGTGVLAFSNPHANGTVVVLKSQGAVVLTSSTAPCVDASGMGAAGGTFNLDGNLSAPSFSTSDNGKVGVYGGATGAGGTIGSSIYKQSSLVLRTVIVAPGAGGAGGIGGGSDGGTGGRGGGGLVIECGGALNFAATVSVSGLVGGIGLASGSPGGGGGAAGICYIIYNTLTANTGTITASGGAGGAASSGSTDASNRGGGGAASPFFAGGAGGIGDAVGSNAPGIGAGGGGGGTNGRAGGSAGATMSGFVVQNIGFA